jgi:hypothetical protein
VFLVGLCRFLVHCTHTHSCTIGILAFKLLGGRFWAIAPSSYTNLGSFARTRFALPATERYATAAKRVRIEQLGRTVGCHTCGTRSLLQPFRRGGTRFVADHMPPKSVAAAAAQQQWWWLRRPVTFRFFPQCVACSQQQGRILGLATNELRHNSRWTRPHVLLRQAGGGANAYFHGWRFRANHLAGGVVGGLAMVTVDDGDDPFFSLQRYSPQSIIEWIQRCRSL